MADETPVVETTETPAVTVTPEAAPTPLSDLFSQTVEDKKTEAKASSPETTTEEPVKAAAEVAPEEAKTEVKAEEVKPDDKAIPAPDEVTAKYEARLKDTRDYATRVNQENAILKQQIQDQGQYLEMINKKLDGTWTDADEAALNAPKGPTPEEAANEGMIQGKIAASKVAAYDKYGEDVVNKTLLDPEGPFQQIMNDPIVKAKVLSSDAPFIEAMKIVEVKQFYDRYGADPASIHKNIKAEVEAELREKITQDVMKKLSGKTPVLTGLRDVRQADSAAISGGIMPLRELFPQ